MSAAPHEHLVFACGAAAYGVPAALAVEVLPLPPVTRVPGAPAHVLGVFVHLGEVLPLVDLSRLAGDEVAEAAARAVILRGRTGAVGVATSRVRGVLSFASPAQALGGDGLRAQLRGPVALPDGELSVLDVDGLLALLARGGR